MIDYVYRVDILDTLRDIKDGRFRARRWASTKKNSYPHQTLVEAEKRLEPGFSLFRMSFYTTLSFAENALTDIFSNLNRPSVILRLSKKELSKINFKEDYDDGLPQGQAYLFWTSERSDNSTSEYSSAGIQFESIEVLSGGKWIPLFDCLTA